ncbi:MAG TPA: GNAT family N-acetyltransferase [Gaiellales bacterium]|jgi:RimJ/RimL family protein N-acetyltransferase
MGDLRTERLLLRRFRADDAKAFAAVNADPLVVRYLGSGEPIDRTASDALLARIIAHWDEHGFGLWAAELRADGRMIGFAGLAIPTFLPAVLPAVEVGWRLRSDVWGGGLATEGGRAALQHAFGPLGLDRVISIIDPRNAASLRVAEKLGLRPWRDEIVPRAGLPARVYALERAVASMAAG